MKRKSIVNLVVEYLFAGMPKPAVVLGQGDCAMFKDTWKNNMRNLEATVCFVFQKFAIQIWWPPVSFDYGRITSTISNTLLVDDCPYNYVCNPDECGLFPNPFTNNRLDDEDMTKFLFSSLSKYVLLTNV